MVLAILAVYQVLLLGVLVAGSPWWLWRMAVSGRYRAGIRERLGFVPKRLRQVCAREQGTGEKDQGTGGKTGRVWVWIHAVSVGEVLAASGVVRGLEAAGFRVAVSTTTQAGQELARARFTECPVFYLPLDFAWMMRRYLDAIRPRLMVTVESELWPSLIHSCRERGIPLVVVNARVSDRSFPRYMLLRWLWRPLLREVSLFLAQGEESAARLRRMGVGPERVRVAGNLKYETVAAGAETEMTRALRAKLKDRRVVVAGSTLAGEEGEMLAAWGEVVRGDALGSVLILAPRHKERFAQVLALMQESGFRSFRCSEWLTMLEPAGSGTVLLLDTIGDLASVYGLGVLAFVGGSLVKKGGHNPLEAARFGVPVVMGESFFNFKEIVGAMRAADAIRIVQREGLAGALVELLRDGDGGMGERGRQVFAVETGATGRTVEALLEFTRQEP